jgi:long-chain acyl-CoA synthetase
MAGDPERDECSDPNKPVPNATSSWRRVASPIAGRPEQRQYRRMGTATRTGDPVRDMLTASGAPFELVEVESDGRTLRAFRNAPRATGEILARAETFGDRTCLVGLDYVLSYGEVLARAAALKAALAGNGLVRGDRIAIAMHNRPEWVVAFMAVAALGATPVLLNYRASPSELSSALAETEVKSLIAEPEIAARTDPVWREGRLIAVTAAEPPVAGSVLLDRLVAAHRGEALDPVILGPDDEGVIIFTSGTSGHPKGALIAQRALMNMVEAIDYATIYGAAEAGLDLRAMAAAGAQTQPSAMLVFPLFHTAGVIAVLLPNLRRGGKMVTLERWRVEDALTLVERERVSGFSGSPAMLWDLLKADRAGRDLSSLRFLSIGGQGITRRLLDELAEAFPGVSFGIGYGQSETGSVNGIGGRNLLQRPTSTGRPLPIIELRIVGDEGEDLEPGEVGEVWVGGVTIMQGYCNRPEETAQTLKGGWVATGDLGRLDEDGFLHIVDRKKNIVVSGGENIGCGEVEAAAVAHPDIEQAVAFGVPDPRLGEKLHIALITRDGCRLDEASLREHIAARLAVFKMPRGFHVCDSFPLNAMGKVDRRALAARFADEVTA